MMKVIAGCRSCGSPRLTQVLDLGTVPLANALLKEDELGHREQLFPLTLQFCGECSLLQIAETVDPSVLFSHYLYFSSFSETMLEHARKEGEALAKRFGVGSDSLVVEIASNDGYLLRNFVSAGIPVLGIEPAENIAKVAEERGVATLVEFFGVDLARRLRGEGKQADLILANNVLAHVADTNGMAEGIAQLLKPEGRAVIEFPYVGDMIANVEFDTIYHEHLCYFSLHAVQALFARHGLRLFDVERLPIHGGSLRIYLQLETTAPEASDAVKSLAEEERAKGMTTSAYYESFAQRVGSLKRELTAELERRKAAGQTLAAYGASAKGSTLLNFFGIDGSVLDYIVDRSTVKQGLFAPGNHLAIVSPDELVREKPDAVLLLTWNFASEIFRQQAAYLEGGGEFIVPVPSVRVVNKEVRS